jgi:hypothetical protein
MEEQEARLALLQTELNSLRDSIKSFDSINFQIKGWCVTTSLAVGGFAIAYRKPGLLIVGIAAVIGFFLVNCQFKMSQRKPLDRLEEIDSELRNTGIMQVLKGAGNIEIVGTALPGNSLGRDASISARVRKGLPDFWFEVRRVNTFSLYLFIGFCMVAEAVILLL